MFFLILGRILIFLLVILAFVGIIGFVYSHFFKEQLIEDTVEDIVDDAAEKRIIKEAKRAANDIEFGDINNTKEDADENGA